MQLKVISNRIGIEEFAVLHPDFYPMNVGADKVYLVDKKHPDFEKYRAMAIANAIRFDDLVRVKKYRSY